VHLGVRNEERSACKGDVGSFWQTHGSGSFAGERYGINGRGRRFRQSTRKFLITPRNALIDEGVESVEVDRLWM